MASRSVPQIHQIITPPRLGRGHLLFGAGLVAIGLILTFDLFSGRPRWFFPHSYPEFEWMWALIAFGAAIARLEQSDQISHERLAETQGVIESGAKMWC